MDIEKTAKERREEIVNSLIEIRLKSDDDFLKVRETLTRMGIASQQTKTLYQSCHILSKKGKYYICHFKNLFQLDMKPTNLTEEDVARRNTIANMLAKWGLVELVEPEKSASPVMPINQIRILAHKDKEHWILESKYDIGSSIRRKKQMETA